MQLLRILGALAILCIAGALFFVLWRARAIKRRHLRVLAAQPSQASLDELGLAGPRLFQSDAALYHGTRFADGAAFLGPALRAPCVGELFCGERALFLRREPGAPLSSQQPFLCWPLSSVEEASLHRGYAPLAGKELPLLRLRWRSGGEQLLSELSLRGGMEQLEKLRREIHLRQNRGEALVQLGKLLQKEPW